MEGSRFTESFDPHHHRFEAQERVMALHALVDESMDLLAALPMQEAGHDE